MKLGVIEYLNVLPIYYSILNGQVPVNAELVRGLPSTLNQQMASGLLDISAISSFEYLRHASSYYLLPHLSVSADGPVGSIFLFSNQELESIQGTVFLSKASLTSNHLVQFLLRNCPVDYTFQDPSVATAEDSLLLIGDDAIRMFYAQKFSYAYDLSNLWKDLTGFPFVFAVWAVRREVYDRFPKGVISIHAALLHSKWLSHTSYAEMADQYFSGVFPEAYSCIKYLKNLRYELSVPFQEGLLAFQQCCKEAGFLSQTATLEFISMTDSSLEPLGIF